MHDVCPIDFETRSGADIKRGLWSYFNDSEADLLCLGYRLPGKDVECWVAGEDMNPFELFQHIRNGGLCTAWNAPFELQAWAALGVRKYGWPSLLLESIRCTMAEAAAMNLPQSLDKCGEALGLPADKQKSQTGRNLIRKLCLPQKITTNQQRRWLTLDSHPELHEKLATYCKQDVVAEESISRKLRRLTEYEMRVWRLTHVVNMRGVPVALDEVANIHQVVIDEVDQLNKELRRITRRDVLAATNRAALLKWVNRHPEMQGYDPIFFEDESDVVEDHHGDYLPDLTKDTVGKVLERDQLPPDVRRVLEIRRQVAMTSVAKYPKLLRAATADGRLQSLLSYHGAGTGRWASRGGINFQNLTRPTLNKLDLTTAHEALGSLSHASCSLLFDDRLMEAASSCLRGVIKAPDGYEFIDADFSSIETRVAAWIAGQEDKLVMFADKLDEYRVFASSMYGVPYDEVTPLQRQTCKPIILGGVFGLGAKGLLDYVQGYGVTMDLEQATASIKALRAEYDRVKVCWYACGNAAIEAVREPGKWVAAGERLRLIVHKGFLWLSLPSGRVICWASPRVRLMEAPWTERVSVGYDEGGAELFEDRPAMRDVVVVNSVEQFTRQWRSHKLIGSSIFQSAVQGTARDVLVNGLFNAEDAGYRTVLLVHDEILSLMPKGVGSPEELGRLMCTPASWMAGLPLAAEGWRGIRYQK